MFNSLDFRKRDEAVRKSIEQARYDDDVSAREIACHGGRSIGQDHSDVASHHRLKAEGAAWGKYQRDIQAVLFKEARLLRNDERRLVGAGRRIGEVELLGLRLCV